MVFIGYFPFSALIPNKKQHERNEKKSYWLPADKVLSFLLRCWMNLSSITNEKADEWCDGSFFELAARINSIKSQILKHQ